MRNFSSSVAVALQSLGQAMPAGWAVLPTPDIDGVIPSLKLSLRLPDRVCLDPHVALWCSVCRLPSQALAKFRGCYFPAAADRVQQLEAFKCGCLGLPIAIAGSLESLGLLDCVHTVLMALWGINYIWC